MDKKKTIGWIIYSIGMLMLVSIASEWKEYVTLVFGTALVITSDKLINGTR